MGVLLLKATAYLFMITLGYMLKKIGFFQPDDYQLISKIVMNITLPAAVITSFGSLELPTTLIFVVLLGTACNLLLLGFGAFLSRRRSLSTRALFMMTVPGYSIGTFTMPFIQSFLGPYGVVVTVLFDTGNAIMVTGGTFAITSHVLKTGGGIKLLGILRILRSSMPFMTYLGILALTLLHIRIPATVVAVISPIGAANAFLAMLMIGLMFEVQLDYASLKKAGIILLFRFLFAGALSLLFYNIMPFPLIIRQVLAIAVFSPISTLAPIFTERCEGDGSLASLVASLSIIISLVMMTILIIVLRIGLS